MIIKYFGSAVLVSSDATQMIKAMTEKAFRKAPRFLYFDGVGSCQPLTHDVRPTKSDSHQKLEVNFRRSKLRSIADSRRTFAASCGAFTR